MTLDAQRRVDYFQPIYAAIIAAKRVINHQQHPEVIRDLNTASATIWDTLSHNKDKVKETLEAIEADKRTRA